MPSPPIIELRVPLVDLSVVSAATGLHTNEIIPLIENGALPWAFNLAVRETTRREIRVLSQCVTDYQHGKRNPIGGSDSLEDALRLIFPMCAKSAPGAIKKVRVDTIARRCSVRVDTVFDWITAGWIQLVPGTVYRAGPGGSPFVEFDSLAAWLGKRRML